MARVVAAFGIAPAKRMLLLADLILPQEGAECGFVTELVAADALDTNVRELCAKLAKLAPVTQRVAKEAIRRVVTETVPQATTWSRPLREPRLQDRRHLLPRKETPEWTGS